MEFQHVLVREYPAFCDAIGGYRRFAEVLVDVPAGAPERLIAEPDGDANDVVLEAVLDAIGQRVVAIVALPGRGPWGDWGDSDGTIVALMRAVDPCAQGDSRGGVKSHFLRRRARRSACHDSTSPRREPWAPGDVGDG